MRSRNALFFAAIVLVGCGGPVATVSPPAATNSPKVVSQDQPDGARLVVLNLPAMV